MDRSTTKARIGSISDDYVIVAISKFGFIRAQEFLCIRK
jgi:hypothetical protein